jgi:hypothetical protein
MASPTDWARAIATTIVQHTREEEIAVFRRFKVFAMLEQSGNILMNQSGRGFDWNVRFRNAPVTGNTGDTPRTFSRINMWKRAELPWRGFTATDSIYRRELLENRGQQALVNVASNMASRLQESLEQYLSYQPYVDGNAAGNENFFHGALSFLGYNGTIDESVSGVATQNTTTTTSGGVTYTGRSGDRFGYPTDTYAGLSTQLGYYGGGRLNATTGTFPDVAVDPEFDFYAPLVVNYNSTGWTGTGKWYSTQNGTAVAATREGIVQCKRNDTRESQIDMVVLDRKLFVGYLNSLESKERAVVSRENGLRAYGFSDVFEQDGCEICHEAAVPPGLGFGMSIGNMELRCLENQLFMAEGPYFSEETQSYRYACSTLGNMRFKSPRNFFLLAPVTGPA